PGGTHVVTEIELAAHSSSPAQVTPVGDLVFFEAAGSVWRSAGTAASTVPIETTPFPFNVFLDPATAGGRIFFWQHGNDRRFQLWSADGSSPAAPLTHFDDSFGPSLLAPLGNRVYFLPSLASGLEMWTSDGTLAGTVKAFDLDGLTAGDGLRRVGSRL